METQDYAWSKEQDEGPAVSPQETVIVSSQGKNKVTAGLLALLLGTWGAHKFYLGYKREGAIMLAVSLISLVLLIFTFGASVLGAAAMGVVAFIEGILYLTKTDEQFEATYVRGHKAWF